MLACRACRVSLSAADGCALCNPVRRHLVVVGEDEDERPSLSGTGSEIVAGLRAQLIQIRAALRLDPTDDVAETRLIRLGNTAAKVLEAARKLQADGVAAVEAMNFVERADLFVTWYAQLTPAYRAHLREKMDHWEGQAARPLAAELS